MIFFKTSHPKSRYRRKPSERFSIFRWITTRFKQMTADFWTTKITPCLKLITDYNLFKTRIRNTPPQILPLGFQRLNNFRPREEHPNSRLPMALAKPKLRKATTITQINCLKLQQESLKMKPIPGVKMGAGHLINQFCLTVFLSGLKTSL